MLAVEKKISPFSFSDSCFPVSHSHLHQRITCNLHLNLYCDHLPLLTLDAPLHLPLFSRPTTTGNHSSLYLLLPVLLLQGFSLFSTMDGISLFVVEFFAPKGYC
ncbi:hypothetical protein MANES_11G101450v8 [Manihot esculenta]|uniref:Uncharacterized protein n=1 Tax=Manihot esculenta TaxID=3983 RepID=A0ACB7GW26_MANES|nr:hypothetical protein MANES_11G101450v8 [Manihot esculenta]